MQHEAFDGVVVRVRDTGDHDKLLSILTASNGRISVLSKGGKSLRGEQRAISQLFTHANFEVYLRSGLYILKGGAPQHTFFGIAQDMDRLNLASYLCDACAELTDEGEPAPDMLRLMLNTLYAISHGLYPLEIIKGAFEFRAAILSGYAPALSGCSRCGKLDDETVYLDVMNGSLLCQSCLRGSGERKNPVGAYDEIREAETLSTLTPSVLAALRYVESAPLERLFAFALKDRDELGLFSACTETYLLSHLGRGFETLNFYHAMRQDDTKGTKL